jgi:hypothetical protein
MTFWEKIINDPERGPRILSPLAYAVIGFGLLFFDLHIFVTGAIRIGKGRNGTYIHFSDHPTAFALTCILATLGTVWGLSNARKRYRMHGT